MRAWFENLAVYWINCGEECEVQKKTNSIMVFVLVAGLLMGCVGLAAGAQKSTGTTKKTTVITVKTSSLAALVKKGTITQTQANTVVKTINAKKPTSQKQISLVLNTLVNKKTITRAQARAILTALTSKNTASASTPASLKAPGKGGPLAALVSAGTITQTQADAVMKALQGKKPGEADIDSILDALVSAGTITETQAKAIEKALSAMPQGGGPGMGSPGGMAPPQAGSELS